MSTPGQLEKLAAIQGDIEIKRRKFANQTFPKREYSPADNFELPQNAEDYPKLKLLNEEEKPQRSVKSLIRKYSTGTSAVNGGKRYSNRKTGKKRRTTSKKGGKRRTSKRRR